MNVSIRMNFAAGFGPFAANHLSLATFAEMQALGVVIGMVANPIAPVVVKTISGDILRRLGGGQTNGAENEP